LAYHSLASFVAEEHALSCPGIYRAAASARPEQMDP
jgi:hypothetical protein